MWWEWCECGQCRNVEYEECQMDLAEHIAFLGRVSKKYRKNLTAEVPSEDYDLSPVRYVKKIRYWHYENYAKYFGYAQGGDHYSEIPECFKAKMRMTFRQPAENLAEWVKKTFLYLIMDGVNTNQAIGLTSGTVLG